MIIADLGAALSTNTPTPYHAVGQKQYYNKCWYQYIEYQTSASVLAVAGSPLGFRTSAPNTVTTDISLSSSEHLMGVAMGTFTSTNRFGWALIQGLLATAGITAKTDTYVASGNGLAWRADKVFGDLGGAGRFAKALAADSGSQLVTGLINSGGKAQFAQ